MLKGILTGIVLGAVVSGGLALTVSTLVPIGAPVDANQLAASDTPKSQPNSQVNETVQSAPVAKAPSVSTAIAELSAPAKLASFDSVAGALPTKVALRKQVLALSAPNASNDKPVQPVSEPVVAPQNKVLAGLDVTLAVVLDQSVPAHQAALAARAANEENNQVQLGMAVARPADLEKPTVASYSVALLDPSDVVPGTLEPKATVPAQPLQKVSAERPAQVKIASLTLRQPADERAPVVRTGSATVRRTQSMTPPTTAGDTTTPRITIGNSSGSLIDRRKAAGGVRINRPTAAAEAPSAAAAQVTEAAVEAEADKPPLQRFARSFENPGAKPLFSIVLIDEGGDLSAAGVGLEALSALELPLTVAIDPSQSDAQDRMREYRYKGIEVLALVDLPKGARATDAEVTMGVALERLPEVVGVMDGLDTGLQVSRDATAQVAAFVGEGGLGLVVREGIGLNSLARVAQRENVPAQSVFRDLDSAGGEVFNIRRTLDQAAFKANRDGAVVLQGKVTANAIQALQEWKNTDRAERIAIAPISAVLQSAVVKQ